MTLEEAIGRERELSTKMLCASGLNDSGKEHLQLAKWLEELKLYRKCYQLPKEDSLRSL